MPVLNISILFLGAKNLCRGFGYVTFALAEDAQQAIDVVKKFGGRQLNISFADKKPKHEKRKLKQGGSTGIVDDGGRQSKSINCTSSAPIMLKILIR